MGKVRVKTIGVEDIEEEEKKKAKIKKAEKIAREKNTESEKQEENPQTPQAKETPKEEKVLKKDKKDKFAKKGTSRSTNYTKKAMQIDKNKMYSITEGLEILKKIKNDKFDETVELHINTTEPGISGTLTLPHGTGKEIRVKTVNDELLAEIEKGKINFDVLIATPADMPKLAKVARILGPRGLMPNPKNGTISEKPEEAAKKFQGGQISYKTESKLPLIHMAVGKVSFENSKLKENITTIIDTIKKNRIKKITLKSTMSPGIRIQL